MIKRLTTIFAVAGAFSTGLAAQSVKEFKDALDKEAKSLDCRVVDFVTSANVVVRSNKQIVTMGLGGESSYITLDVKGVGEVFGVGYKDI